MDTQEDSLYNTLFNIIETALPQIIMFLFVLLSLYHFIAAIMVSEANLAFYILMSVLGVLGLLAVSWSTFKLLDLQKRFYQNKRLGGHAEKTEDERLNEDDLIHDLNNALATMNGYAAFLMDDLTETSPEHKFASNISKAGQEALKLIEQRGAIRYGLKMSDSSSDSEEM